MQLLGNIVTNKQSLFLLDNIEILSKLEKFQKAISRNNYFTSSKCLSFMVQEHKTGYYYIGTGVQCKVSQFVSFLGTNTRKPKNSKSLKEFYFGEILF